MLWFMVLLYLCTLIVITESTSVNSDGGISIIDEDGIVGIIGTEG